MTEELIKEINQIAPDDQGIFKEPYAIPVHIKEPVVYTRWCSGGRRGGGYRENEIAHRFEEKEPSERFRILDLILEKLKPNITYLQYKVIDNMWRDNTDTEYEYYGNSIDWEIRYIILSDLEKYLDTF